ncbi:MAG: hypothetical protein RIB58_09335 [Phycisphaerales bacterium]|jgi:hypothetical protein
MMRAIGLVLLLLGLAVMIAGLALAFYSFVGIYQSVASDPLAETAGSAEPEREAARQMLVWAGVGFAGAVLAAIGATMSLFAKRKRRRAQRLARG